MMQAGRELDALVADKVMGLRVFNDKREYREPIVLLEGAGERPPFKSDRIQVVKPYSTDIAAAWQVVVKLALTVEPTVDDDEAIIAWCAYQDRPWIMQTNPTLLDTFVEEDTAPLAICLAALKAVNERITDDQQSISQAQSILRRI